MRATAPPRTTTWHIPLLAGLAHAILMFLAAPPISFWGLALVAIWPLAWAATRPDVRPRRDALLAAAGVIPLWAVSQWWVRDVSEFGYYPLVIVLSLFTALFVYLVGAIAKRTPSMPLALLIPAGWTGLEFFRGELFMDGYAWGFVSHPLIDAPGVPAVASVGGAYLVSALIAFIAGVAGDLWWADRSRRRGILTANGVIAVFLAAGIFVLGLKSGIAGTSRRFIACAVQTNLPQSNKIAWTVENELRDFDRFAALTREAAAKSPAFIVWPETMMPGLTLQPDALEVMRDKGLQFRVRGASGERMLDAAYFADSLAELSREIQVPMLIGEEGIDGFAVADTPDGIRFDRKARYNSVYLVNQGRTADLRYDKLFLTPFGEVMPYIHHWPRLQQAMLDLAAKGMAFDLTPGLHRTVFEIPHPEGPIRAVTPICFEITSGRVCRRLVFESNTRRADLIVNLTNDGWFGSSDLGRAQHLQIARWRAAELGTPILRAANTGISAIIGTAGQLQATGVEGISMATRRDGVLCGEIETSAGPTVYARLGDTAGWICFGAALVLAVRTASTAWKSRRTQSARPQ